jgi:UDP-3-O-[3-hydroxymyristoyl] glucosamine N-acyltransferase
MNYQCVAESVVLGENVRLSKFINLYGCRVGDHTKIGAFVEIQKNSAIGKNCKISSHSFVCEGVTIEDGVFIGHGVMFTNDKYPRAANPDHRQAGRVHRIQRHYRLRRDHRRAGDRGRRRGGHERRSRGYDRSRQSGAAAAKKMMHSPPHST